MGIKVEFNSTLALRAHGTAGRLEEECVPEILAPGKFHKFLEEGQRIYSLGEEMPLRITEGNKLSRPLASVTITEVAHLMRQGTIYTRGTYTINEVYDPNSPEIHFEGMEKVR